MKKLIILLAILLSSINASATDYKAVRLNFRNVGYQWVGWQQTNIDIAWDYDSRKLVIYSDEVQVIDYWNIKESYSNGVTMYTMNADDTQNHRLILQIYVYNNGGAYIKMLYSNVEYKYELRSL